MQIVDVLRHDRRHLAGAIEAGERAMAAARLRVAEFSSMAKRRRQNSLRASWLARNSSNGIGRFLVHIPPGERKSGMPHSVEMPAPVNGTIDAAPWTISRRRAMAALEVGSDHPCDHSHPASYISIARMSMTYMSASSL